MAHPPDQPPPASPRPAPAPQHELHLSSPGDTAPGSPPPAAPLVSGYALLTSAPPEPLPEADSLGLSGAHAGGEGGGGGGTGGGGAAHAAHGATPAGFASLSLFGHLADIDGSVNGNNSFNLSHLKPPSHAPPAPSPAAAASRMGPNASHVAALESQLSDEGSEAVGGEAAAAGPPPVSRGPSGVGLPLSAEQLLVRAGRSAETNIHSSQHNLGKVSRDLVMRDVAPTYDLRTTYEWGRSSG